MRLHRVASIAGEKSINFELNFQILSDDRGPGPLSSDEIWEFNFYKKSLLIFPQRLKGHDEAVPQGSRFASLNPVRVRGAR